jgi:hypothetical protein
MDTEVRALIAKLETQRRAAMDMLLSLSDDDLGYWYTQSSPGDEEAEFTIRRLIYRITTHHRDHLQHVLKARKRIGKPRDETARALGEMFVARTELISALLGLTDEDIRGDVSAGDTDLGYLRPRDYFPEADKDAENSIKRIVEHVVEMEEMRLGHIRQALDMNAGARPR